MIIRIWHAQTRPGMELEYWQYLNTRGSAELEKHKGLLAQHIGKGLGSAEFVQITVWDSLESVKGFAGLVWQHGSVLPGEERFVLRCWVEHFEDSRPLSSIDTPP